MKDNMRHPVLEEQVRKYLGENAVDSPEMKSFLNAINETYQQLEENETEVSSEDLVDQLKSLLADTGIRKLVKGDSTYIINAVQELINHTKAVEIELTKLSVITQETNNGVVLTDAEGRVQWINSSMEKMSSCPKDEWVNKRPRDLFTFIDAPVNQESFEAIARYYEKPEPYNLPFTFINVEGEQMWVNVSNTPIFDDDGKLEQQIEIVTDITEEKQYEQELKQLSEIVKNVENGVLVSDNEGRIKYCNKYFSELLEVPVDEIVGKTVQELMPLVEGAPQYERYRKFVEDPHAISMELEYTGASGRIKWLRIDRTPVYRDGEFYQTIAIVIDISEAKFNAEMNDQLMKKLEISYAEIETLNKILACSIQSGIRVTTFLERSVEILNRHVKEEENRLHIVFDSTGVSRGMKSFLIQSVRGPIYLCFRKETLSYFSNIDFIVTANTLLNSIVSGIEKDEMLIREVIRTEQNERERLSRELSEGICKSLTVVSERFKQVEGHRGESEAQQAIEMLDEVIGDIHQLSENLIPKEIQDIGVVIAICNMVEELNKRTEINFTCTTDVERESFGNIDLVIYRIVQEAIDNIIKHSDASNASINVRTERGEVVITIIDDGHGFVVRKKFKSFGINSMRSRVESLNGEIDIKSQKGNGTTVIAKLPMG